MCTKNRHKGDKNMDNTKTMIDDIIKMLMLIKDKKAVFLIYNIVVKYYLKSRC